MLLLTSEFIPIFYYERRKIDNVGIIQMQLQSFFSVELFMTAPIYVVASPLHTDELIMEFYIRSGQLLHVQLFPHIKVP